MTDRLKIGTLVEHPTMPEWGPGKVLAFGENKIAVYFRDAVKSGGGNPRKQISTRHVELRVAAKQSDPILDAYREVIPKTTGRKAAAPKKPVGTLEDGIALFELHYPDGFRSPAFMGTDKIGKPGTGERQYKVTASEAWRTCVQSGEARKLFKAGSLDDLTAKLLAANAGTNLLFPMEKSALVEGLKDKEAATRLYGALLDLVESKEATPELLTAYFDALCALPHAEGKSSPAKWPVASFPLFFAAPDRFMFLKPKATQECAARLGFNLSYSPTPNASTFMRLTELSEQLLERLRPMGAEDLLDVQSFIWVIHSYAPKTPAAAPAAAS